MLLTTQEKDLAEAAQRLAEHWKREADRQAARAEAANVTKMESDLLDLRQQLAGIEGRRLEAEAQVPMSHRM